MAHPYNNHREMQVGHRRVKTLMASGGYASDKGLAKAATGFAQRVAKHEKAEMAEEKHEGENRGGRLDKRARGGAIEGKANGGGVMRKFTPSKHKPHVAVNVINVSRHPRPPVGLPGRAAGPIPVPPAAPGLGGPPVGMPMRRFKDGGKIGVMRKGKKYGEGSGEGRLEEAKHMKGR